MKKSAQGKMMAPCGLDCSRCNLFTAVSDESAAESLVGWFRQEGWLKPSEGAREIMQRGPYCNGCRGDRAVQWSGDCVLRKCCTDKRHLESCGQCSDFPCDQLTAWAKKGAHHAKALGRLKSMRKAKT